MPARLRPNTVSVAGSGTSATVPTVRLSCKTPTLLLMTVMRLKGLAVSIAPPHAYPNRCWIQACRTAGSSRFVFAITYSPSMIHLWPQVRQRQYRVASLTSTRVDVDPHTWHGSAAGGSVARRPPRGCARRSGICRRSSFRRSSGGSIRGHGRRICASTKNPQESRQSSGRGSFVWMPPDFMDGAQ